VFILGGDILTIPHMLSSLYKVKKLVFIHMDLIEGLGSDEAAVKFVATKWHPFGLISTRGRLIKLAKKYNLVAIQRLFLLDSASIVSGKHVVESVNPDMVELMPGVIPKAISDFCIDSKYPVIAGGMITQKQEVILALKAGAVAVSTSNNELWIEGDFI